MHYVHRNVIGYLFCKGVINFVHLFLTLFLITALILLQVYITILNNYTL